MRNHIIISAILFLFVSSACTLQPPEAQIAGNPVETEPQQQTVHYAFSRSYESGSEIALTGFVDFLCEPGPGMLPAPKVAVALNFAPARPVQGFIFLRDFLADEQVSRLHEIVGFDGNNAANCSEETKAVYNKTMQQIIQEVQNGASDAETQGNFQAMFDLAKSVTINHE